MNWHSGGKDVQVRSREKGPRNRSPRDALWLRMLCAAAFLGLSGCSREHYKADADKETYKIIESKWQDDFGVMANYRVSDSEPNAAEVQAMVPPSGVIRLVNAVEMATQYSREYQSKKETLYLSALGLAVARDRAHPLLFA